MFHILQAKNTPLGVPKTITNTTFQPH